MSKNEAAQALAALGHASLGVAGRKARAIKAAAARWKGHKKAAPKVAKKAVTK